MAKPLVFRIKTLDCPACLYRWRARCREVGDTKLIPTCPQCGANPRPPSAPAPVTACWELTRGSQADATP